MKNLNIISIIAICFLSSGCLESDDETITPSERINQNINSDQTGDSEPLTAEECTNEDNDIAIQTVADDYSSSSVAIGCSTGLITEGYNEELASDYTVSAGSNSFYHLGRSYIDTISKIDFLTPSNSSWLFSTIDAEESTSNPYKLVEISENKAYLIRYNTSSVWIVDPSATSQEQFKIGELDLSAYLVSSEIETESGNETVTATATDMSDAISVDGKLYIAMQRLRNGQSKQGQYGEYDVRNYANDSIVAVFDVSTDTEIDTSPSDSENLNGIILNGHNVQSLAYQGNTLYAASRGNYYDDFGTLDAINLTNYEVSTVISGDENQGAISDVTITTDGNVFVMFDKSGYDDNGEYTYLHNVAKLDGSSIESSIFTSYIHLTDIEADPNGFLWISSAVSSYPGILKIDPNNYARNLFLTTTLNPSKIVFAK